MKTAIATCLLLSCAVVAQGDVLFPAALTLETGMAMGPQPPFPLQTHDALGAPLLIVGRVASVGEPFQDLLPSGNYELTYVIEGSTCTTVGNFDSTPCYGGEFAEFRGGTFTVYLDLTPDANFIDNLTFRDGDAVLVAGSVYISVAESDPYEGCPWLPDEPDVATYSVFAGGLWFDRVSNQGVGFEQWSGGELYYDVPPALQSLGYVCGVDGAVDIYGPVAVRATTWGAVKALYR